MRHTSRSVATIGTAWAAAGAFGASRASSRVKPSAPIARASASRASRLLGQAIVLDSMPVALEPDRADDLAQPVRHDDGQVVERGAQRLGHQFEQVQIVHGGEHVRAVGALLAPRLDQVAFLEALEYPVQKQVLRLARDEASAELGEHAEVEAGIDQLEPERVFPID